MDQFGVPKKINRHVLKAVYFLNARGRKNAKHAAIMNVVRATMRSNIPNDLSAVVLKSLRSLNKLGLIRKSGWSFSMHHKNEHKEDRKSKLNPNLKKRHISESSSEGDVEKSRRRFSVNRPLARRGQRVELPKVRRSQSYFDVPVDENVSGDTLQVRSATTSIGRDVNSPDNLEVPVENCEHPQKKDGDFVMPSSSEIRTEEGKQESASKKIKSGQNSRKRRNSDASSSDSASKKKQVRSRQPATRKRPQMESKSQSDMSLQNAFLGQNIVTVKATGVQTIQYDGEDGLKIDGTQNEIRDSDSGNPEATQPNEASCSSSIPRHEDEGAVQQVRSVTASISRDVNSPDNPEVPVENCEHPQKKDGDFVMPSSSEIRTEEGKQSDVKSQHSLRKIYKSNNFSKNSEMEVGSHQNQDQSVKGPVEVTKPNSKQSVQDIPQEEGE